MSGTDGLEGNAAVYKTLLESTKAIPWRIDWATLKFSYIGPQIEDLLGWSADSWKSVEDWAMRMHPDDRETVVNYCVSQSKEGIDHEADYRALTKDNGYVWIRDVVHVVRDANGEVEALIGFMFDISERKKTEDQLLTLQKELEVLSFKDGLTGVSNRRSFDCNFEQEWMRAKQEGSQLSLLLLDVDFFKQYNDLYGHMQGDKCLTTMAHALGLALTGPRDSLSRYGGEEFVVLLPEADAKAARKVAELCQRQLSKADIVHALSPHCRRVTASIGVGTVRPAEWDAGPAEFLNAVDQQLYAAKSQGRNRIEYVELETSA